MSDLKNTINDLQVYLDKHGEACDAISVIALSYNGKTSLIEEYFGENSKADSFVQAHASLFNAKQFDIQEAYTGDLVSRSMMIMYLLKSVPEDIRQAIIEAANK